MSQPEKPVKPKEKEVSEDSQPEKPVKED